MVDLVTSIAVLAGAKLYEYSTTHDTRKANEWNQIRRISYILQIRQCKQKGSVNTEGLGLAAGVEMDDRGCIKVDRDYKTTADGIYAAGDVLGPSLASVAMEQGRIAACRIFRIELKGLVDPMRPSAVYSMPEVAGVGLTEEQCQSQGLDYAVGRSDLSLIPRGAIAGHGGILKLIFSKKDRRLLAVHCFGDIASELVGIGQMVIHFNGTIDTFLEVTLNTPTYTYAYKYAAIDGMRKLDNFKQEH